MLGQHYLSHRELGIFHRGDLTRVYLQELCTYDPVEAPIPCTYKYQTQGHTDVATWKFNIQPVAHAKLRKEGSLLNSTETPYVEVALQGEGLGQLEFTRHAETYQITSLPSIILAAPLQEQCPLDFDGICNIECAATGLRAVLKFKPWVQQQQEGGGGGPGAVAAVKGEVRRLSGDGETKIAKFKGHWQNQITVQGLENNSEGILFDIQDFPPVFTTLPPSINLANPGPQTVARFWSALIESILYLDKDEVERGGKSVVEMVNSLLTDELRKSLLYTPSSSVSNGAVGNNMHGNGVTKEKKIEYEDADAEIAAQDSRPLPPAIRLQRALGRCLSYQLQYVVQSLTQAALEKESEEMEAVKIAVAAEGSTGGGGGIKLYT
jgi:hypothetical protein